MPIVQLGRLRSRLMVTHLSRQVVEPGLEPRSAQAPSAHTLPLQNVGWDSRSVIWVRWSARTARRGSHLPRALREES